MCIRDRLKDEDFNNDAKDAGDMGAGHTVTAFYEVIPTGVKNEYVGKIDDLKYQKKEKVSVKPTGSNDCLLYTSLQAFVFQIFPLILPAFKKWNNYI